MENLLWSTVETDDALALWATVETLHQLERALRTMSVFQVQHKMASAVCGD